METATATVMKRPKLKMTSTALSGRPSQPIPLSRREKELLKLIGSKPVTSTDLMKRYYRDERTPPFNARQIVVSRVKTIMAKLEVNKSDKRVRQTKRRGPNPVSYWVETVEPKKSKLQVHQ